MRELVAAVAGPREWGETRESWLARSARMAGVTYRQAKAVFYGEITDDDHRSVRRMKQAARELRGRREAQELAAQFESIARSAHEADTDFHSEDVAALVHAARILRGFDRT